MTITLVDKKTITETASNSTAATVSLSNTNVNDLIIVGIGLGNSATDKISSVTMAGASFSKITGASKAYTGSGDTNYVTVWYAYGVSAQTAPTLSINKTGAVKAAAVIFHYTGFTVSNPLDKSNVTETDSSTKVTSGSSGTLEQANELIVGIGTDNFGTGQVYTLGSGFGNLTSTINADISVAMEDIMVTSTSATSAGFSLSNSTDNTGSILTFLIPSAQNLLLASGF